MKIGIVGDVHWSEYSSIVRRKLQGSTVRLENLRESVKWADETLRHLGADMIIQLGDFFDKSYVTGTEGAVLRELYEECDISSWHFLKGNHEIDGARDSLSLIQAAKVYREPSMTECDSAYLVFMPYIEERHRKPLSEYMADLGVKRDKKVIVFSHNDIAGVRYGKYESKTGFSVEEIHANCDKFINGHIHNSEEISDKILNAGNLTGQNFSENGFIYHHGVWIIDTEKEGWMWFEENPFALKFGTVNITNETEEAEFDSIERICQEGKGWVLAINATEEYADEAQKVIDKYCVAGKKTIMAKQAEVRETESISIVDHIQKFRESVIEKFGNTEIVAEVLDEVR